ncbi:DUF4429 domain-containing protein [Arthrobacter zhaoguopingii]|uniref:DUF4429 domain-containing protein n=1 Tax=Arthrobacter zhaoguopingii TaxID=2681491 RepID=UPI00135BACAE|nr:DUF4429 domain-containing protein [Arthrobacter zhaoguopingii]
MGNNQEERSAKVRRKHGILMGVPIWNGRQGWAAYADGLLTVKMTITKAVVIPVQDLAPIDFRSARSMTAGYIRFSREGGKFGDRQEIIFGSQDEGLFAQLKHLLEDEQRRGVQGSLPEEPQAEEAEGAEGEPGVETLKDEKYRAKYKIPADAVLARSAGMGYVAFDRHYVTLQWVGLGRGIVGKGVKRIPLTAITSVQMKPAGLVMSGFIQFSFAGANDVRSAFGRQSWDAMGDENTMSFNAPDEYAFLKLRDAIEQAQRALHQPVVVQTAPAPEEDVFAHLEKLGKLRDAGIVSEAEFAAKKAELLGRI